MNELYELLGRDIALEQEALPLYVERYIKLGKKWFDEQNSNLKNTICGSDKIEAIARDNDAALLLVAIADAISGVITGVSPFTVAAVIIKIGYKNFCD